MNIPRWVAYHEAGHAAIAIHFGFGVKRVSVIPTAEARAHCAKLPQPSLPRLAWDNSDRLIRKGEKHIMVALAGMEAQRRYAPRSVRSHHAQLDLKAAFTISFNLSGSEDEASALVQLLQIRTRNLLHLPHLWSGVSALARQLLKRKEISGREARRIVEAAILA